MSKFYEKQLDPNNPFCTINEPGRLRVVLPLVTPEFNQLKETVERLSPSARDAIRSSKRLGMSGDARENQALPAPPAAVMNFRRVILMVVLLWTRSDTDGCMHSSVDPSWRLVASSHPP